MIKQKILRNILFICLFAFNSIYSTIEYLDTTYGPNATGIVETVIGSSSRINGITQNSSNQIISAGLATLNGVQNIAIAKYDSNGNLDNSFGLNGIVTTLIGSNCYANAVTVDSNNFIVVTGTAVISGVNNVVIARYNTSGSADLNFGTGGNVTKLVGTSSIANAIAIDADGKILVAGTATVSGKPNLFVVRYNSNGTLDTAFGVSGVRTLTANSGYTCSSIQIDQSAKIVLGGSQLGSGITSNFLVAKLTTAGVVDTTFGSNGVVKTTIPSATVSSINSIRIDSSNKIITAGYSGNGTVSNFTTARYNSDGSLDTSYGAGSNGIQVSTIGSNSQINSCVIDLNGKIVVGGLSDNKFTIARYAVNGSLDTSFGVSGVLTTSLGDNAQINSLLIQNSDGRAVAGGTANNSGQLQFTSLRYNKNNIDYINITSIGQTVNTKTPIIGGISSAANAQVQVSINGALFTTTSTDSMGGWNAGMTTILPVGLNAIKADLIVNSNIIVSEKILVNVIDNFSDEALFVYSTTPQTSFSNTYHALAFDQITRLGTWSYNNSNFTCNKSGMYLIQYSGNPNVNGTINIGTSAVNIAMAVSINDIEYLGSESCTNVIWDNNPTQNHYARTLTRSFIKTLNQGDIVNLNFAVNVLGDNTGFNAGLMQNPNAIGVQPCYSLTISRIG